MHRETVLRLSRLVAQEAEGAGGFDAGIPPVTRFESVDDVERIANNLELASGPGLTGTLVDMEGVFYELALKRRGTLAMGSWLLRHPSWQPQLLAA